jgi:hypothetical protein
MAQKQGTGNVRDGVTEPKDDTMGWQLTACRTGFWRRLWALSSQVQPAP